MNQTAVEKLNRLLRAEYASLVHRLGEADPYVSWTSAADRALIERMVADERDHARELTNMILELRGAPAPPTFDTASAGAHFLQLDYLMPQVIASKRRLVVLYESTGPTGDPRADALVARILAEHRRHCEELVRLRGGVSASV